jgi:hypothetical protein
MDIFEFSIVECAVRTAKMMQVSAIENGVIEIAFKRVRVVEFGAGKICTGEISA